MKKETITLTTIVELLQRLETKMDDKFDMVDQRFEQIDARFESIDQRFEQIDARFESIDARFESIDARFESIDARFESIDARFESIDARFESIDARFESIDQRFDKLDVKIDTEIENLATMVQIGFAAERKITNERFDRIEEKLTFMQQDMKQMNLKICDIQAALPQFVTRNEFEQRLAA